MAIWARAARWPSAPPRPARRSSARSTATVVCVLASLMIGSAARAATGLATVCLSGGVFQNAWLADALLGGLANDGFDVHINERVPVNDGGISYGQAAVAAARMAGTDGSPAVRRD